MFRSAIKGEKNQGFQDEDITYDDLEAIFASKEFKPECDQKLVQNAVVGGGFHRLGSLGLYLNFTTASKCHVMHNSEMSLK